MKMTLVRKGNLTLAIPLKDIKKYYKLGYERHKNRERRETIENKKREKEQSFLIEGVHYD